MTKRTIFKKFKTGFNSIAVLTLLLPNLMSIGIVAAEEAEVEDPPTEEVEELNDSKATDGEMVDTPAEENAEETPEVPAIEETVEEEESAKDSVDTPENAEESSEAPTQEVAPAQEPGISQENLVYENGILTLHNQIEGTNIAAVLPNDSLIFALVPFHGRWSPRQNLSRNQIYAGDEIEFFTYSGNSRGESIFLTVEGEGEERPAEGYRYQYGRMHFGFIPTERDSRVTYRTEPFFTVEMTFPNGEVLTDTASALGQVAFPFADANYTPTPGELFTARVLDRDGNEVDLTNLDLFRNLTVPNQSEIRVYGEVPPEPVAHTVTINPNGGTIDEEYASTEVDEGDTFTVPYNFQSNLARPGYTLTGYTVEGTLLDSNGNAVTELPRTTGTYTPMSDVTLTANWELTNGGFRILLYDETPATQTDRYTVTLVAEDGTEYPLSSRSYSSDHRTWTIDDVPNGHYTLVIDGYTISDGEKFGQADTTSDFTVNEDGTASIELEFVDNKSTSFIRYRVYGDPIPTTNTVTIHPNGGTIDEEYASTEVDEGDTYTVPYTFQSNLARPGYTLTGYSVEGTLLDSNGNEVTELSRFTGTYTPITDVTLTAIWEVTSGGVRIRDHIGNFRTADRSFELTDGENTYPLTSNSYTNLYREWRVDDVPNGVYTLLVDGIAYPGEWNLETTNAQSSASISEDGTVSLDLTFADNSSTTFVRFDLTMNEYEIGVEVRDLAGRRTSDVGVVVEDADGAVFEGTFDEYNLWTTNEEVLPGTYTITLDTPAGTIAEINDTVASQMAVETDEENVFTLEVNKNTLGNLSRVFGAFRLVEVPVTYPLGVEVRDLNNRRTSDIGVVVTDEDRTIFEGSFDQYHLWTSEEGLLEGTYTITLTTPEGTIAEINPTVASQVAEPTDEENVFTIEVNEETQGNLTRVFGAFRLVEVPEEIEQYALGIEVRDLNNRRTADIGVVVTDADGTVFEGSFNQYAQWLSDSELPVGEYTITLETPENTIAEINPTVASQVAEPTDEENVFTILINAENKGNLSAVFGAFRLVEIEEPAPETEADRYEPVFVDEIVLDLNRGNGKLKNPKTYIQNMNEMPGGFTVDYTNLDQIDLTGNTTDTQTLEITTTYRDGSQDVSEVPLRVIPEEKPGRPGLGNIIRTVKRVVKTVINIISSIFSWFN